MVMMIKKTTSKEKKAKTKLIRITWKERDVSIMMEHSDMIHTSFCDSVGHVIQPGIKD